MHRRIPDISKIRELIGWGSDAKLDVIIDDVAGAYRIAEVV